MEKQNITISVPKEVLKKVKHIAVERGTSVSALIITMMRELDSKEDSYEIARRRQLKIMKKGFDLGTNGEITWDRDSLHDR